jgi:AAA domain/Primase C terminal 2 (PriCT-2)
VELERLANRLGTVVGAGTQGIRTIVTTHLKCGARLVASGGKHLHTVTCNNCGAIAQSEFFAELDEWEAKAKLDTPSEPESPANGAAVAANGHSSADDRVAEPGPEPRPQPKRARSNPDDTRRFLELIAAPDAVFEIRALDVPKRGTVTGYYDADHIDAAVKAATSLSGDAVGVYITVNPVDSSLQARAVNRLRDYTPKGESVKDENIPRRRFVPLDFDYDRPSGISATDEEHELALERMRECADALEGEGITPLLVGDSGNGGHILLAVDLFNDDESLALIKRLYEALKAKFGASPVKFDVANSNAARIWKIYGTLAAKGDHTADRPHRLARILGLRTESDSFEDFVVSHDQLEALATKWAPPTKQKTSSQNDAGQYQQRRLTEAEIADALTYISDRDDRTTWLHVGMALKSAFGEAGRPLWDYWSRGSSKFEPTDQDQTWEGFTADGGITIGTLIKMAKDGGWSPAALTVQAAAAVALTQTYEPGFEQPERRESDRIGGLRTVTEYLRDEAKRASRKNYVTGLLRAGEFNLVLGRPFTGKSSLAAALVRSLVLGIPFLGRPCTKAKVGYFALERNGAAVARLFEKWGVADQIYFTDEVPARGAAEYIEREIKRLGLEAVVIDHLQQVARVQKGNEYAEVSNALAPYQRTAATTGCCTVALHHQGKGERTDADEVIDAMGSEAYRAAADTLIETTKSKGEYFLRAQTRGGIDLPRTWVTLNFDTGEIDAADAHQLNLEAAITEIRDFLSDGESKTEREIREGVGGRGIIVGEALRLAFKRETLRRDGKGGGRDPFRYSCLPHPSIGRPGHESENGSQVFENKGDSASQNARGRDVEKPSNVRFEAGFDSPHSQKGGEAENAYSTGTYEPNRDSGPKYLEDPSRDRRDTRDTRDTDPDEGEVA